MYVENMYSGIKSSISLNGFTLESFSYNVGVRQGEILSPPPFFGVHYLEDFLLEKNIGWGFTTPCIEDELLLYMELFIFFYRWYSYYDWRAEDLQNALNEFLLSVVLNGSRMLLWTKQIS